MIDHLLKVEEEEEDCLFEEEEEVDKDKDMMTMMKIPMDFLFKIKNYVNMKNISPSLLPNFHGV